MIQEKEIVKIDLLKSDDLGLKIIVAKDINTENSFAVITEVNPFGVAYQNQIEIGDILLSINGVDINNYNVLSNLITEESLKNNNNHNIQLKIHKKGSFSTPGLLNASLNSPCSDFCKVWGDSKWKLLQKKEKPINIQTKPNYEKMKPSIFYSYDFQVPQLKKGSLGNTEETIYDRNTIQLHSPKYTYQKAIPMKRKDYSQKTTLKPKKSSQSHVIQPPQPMFIKRRNQQSNQQNCLQNPQFSKSLTDLSTSIDKPYSNGNSQPHSASSSKSTDSFSETQNAYVPKRPTRKQLVNSNFKPTETSVPRSNSSDLIIIDFKNELEHLIAEPRIPNSWRVGNKFQRQNQIKD